MTPPPAAAWPPPSSAPQVSPSSAPQVSPMRGMIGGVLAVVVYGVFTIGDAVFFETISPATATTWIRLLIRLAGLVAVLGIVFASAQRRRGAVAGLLAVAGVLWLCDIVFDAIVCLPIDSLADLVWRMYYDPTWVYAVVSSLTLAALLAAWLLGRRASLATLVVVPLAVIPFAFAQVAIWAWVGGGAANDNPGEDSHFYLFSGSVAAVTIVIVVGAAWIGVAIDRMQSKQ